LFGVGVGQQIGLVKARFIDFDLRHKNSKVSEIESKQSASIQANSSGLDEVELLRDMLSDPTVLFGVRELVRPLGNIDSFTDLPIASLAFKLHNVAVEAASLLFVEDLKKDEFQSVQTVFDLAKASLIKLTGIEGVVALMLSDEILPAAKKDLCIEALLEDRYNLSDNLLDEEVSLLLWLTQKTKLLPLLISVFVGPQVYINPAKVLPFLMQLFCVDKLPNRCPSFGLMFFLR